MDGTWAFALLIFVLGYIALYATWPELARFWLSAGGGLLGGLAFAAIVMVLLIRQIGNIGLFVWSALPLFLGSWFLSGKLIWRLTEPRQRQDVDTPEKDI